MVIWLTHLESLLQIAHRKVAWESLSVSTCWWWARHRVAESSRSDPPEASEGPNHQGQPQYDHEYSEGEPQVRSRDAVRHNRADPASNEYCCGNDHCRAHVDVVVAIVLPHRRESDRRQQYRQICSRRAGAAKNPPDRL